jgi:hypothetical protein
MDVRSIRKQVREYDWQGFVRDAIANGLEFASEYTPGEFEDERIETDDNNQIVQVIGSSYLGSILSISPSGKYYLPFACGNVDECSRCHGSGQGKIIPCQYCHGSGRRSLETMANDMHETLCQIKANIRQRSPECAIDEQTNTIECWVCNGSGQTHETCAYCGGLGSREAYEDQVWNETLDECATRHGGSIESGEGDPTDVFFTLWVDVKRATFGELKTASRDL